MNSVRESIGEWAKTLRALSHVPTVLFAVAVLKIAHWFKQNGWLLATLKVASAVSVLAALVWVMP